MSSKRRNLPYPSYIGVSLELEESNFQGCKRGQHRWRCPKTRNLQGRNQKKYILVEALEITRTSSPRVWRRSGGARSIFNVNLELFSRDNKRKKEKSKGSVVWETLQRG